MTVDKIIEALREMPFLKTEKLTTEQAKQLGTDNWTSCDIDRVGMEAADQLENQNAHIAALQQEIEKLRGQVPRVKYEDTGLTPQEVISMQGEWCAMMSVLNSIGGGYTRLRELAEADRAGRLVVLPWRR